MAKRVIGTTEEAIARAEAQLPHALPTAFREWLKRNNGLGLESANIFPVLDDRDPRKTWDSIVRQYEQWRSYAESIDTPAESVSALLPFAEYGTGDYYCFDFQDGSAEPTGVRWSHETGLAEFRASSFSEFAVRLAAGEFEQD